MKNLAGRADANAVFAAELYECGIPCEPVPPPAHRPEVDVSIQGRASLPGGFSLRVERRWLYTCAAITPRPPADLAVKLASSRFSGSGATQYSTVNGLLGGVARAEGYGGGLFGSHLITYAPEGIGFWHVDSVSALRVLVNQLHVVIASSGINAEEAARGALVVTTELWLRECAPALAAVGVVGEIIRESLHTSPDIDPGNPHIVALRAKYPRVPCGST